MPVKERGVLLTVWLALMLAANMVTLMLYLALAVSPFGYLLLPSVPAWAVYIFTSLGALNLVCVCFLFLWKKWAFFALCVSAAIALAVNLYVGVGAFAFLGLAGAVISYILLRPKWALFDDF